jgi:hypothetical protein
MKNILLYLCEGLGMLGETSNSRIFSHLQPFLGLQNNRSMDNNIWHHSPKVDLNKFDGSDPLGWVT